MTMHTPKGPDGVNYYVGGLDFELNDDGSLTISGGHKSFKQWDVFALMMFFRFPHVVELIEAANTRKQQEFWDTIHAEDEAEAERARQAAKHND